MNIVYMVDPPQMATSAWPRSASDAMSCAGGREVTSAPAGRSGIGCGEYMMFRRSLSGRPPKVCHVVSPMTQTPARLDMSEKRLLSALLVHAVDGADASRAMKPSAVRAAMMKHFMLIVSIL